MWEPRILVVEDELGPRESYRQILKNDYEVILMDNGRVAIEYMTNHPVDVALVDIKMPDMDGIEVLKRIKTIRPEIEVIMITAYASVENAQNAIKYGAIDYLIKPASVKEIQTTVKKALARRIQRMQYDEKLSALLQVSQSITSSLDVQDVKKIILDWVEKLFFAQIVWLALYNSQSEEIELTEVRGPISEEIVNAFSHNGEGITEAVLAKKQIIVADVTTDERVRYKNAALKAKIKSIVGLPLMIQDKVIGVLGFSSPMIHEVPTPNPSYPPPAPPKRGEGTAERSEPLAEGVGERGARGSCRSEQFEEQQTIEPTQMNLLTIFTNQAAIALENARLYSDLKHSEQKLQESLEQLQHTQEHLIQIEKLRALGEMASGVAHNFNNILTGVLGYTSLLLESNMDDKKMLISGLKQIDKAGKSAATLVKKIQTYAKPQVSGFGLVDVNKIIEDTVELTKPGWKNQRQEKGITVLMEMELGRIQPVIGDEEQLKEVLANLILNAVDAMSEGGQLTITTSSESESIIIMVSDSGIGMTEDVRKRIFEPFFTTKTEVGTGLGLSTSYNIIQNHQGEITCESEPKKGATFTIRLPKAFDTKVEQEPLSAAESHSPPAHILVIDDEASIRDVLQIMLSEYGHQVVCVDNAEAGLQTFSDQFDMVMTDLGMPGMNGYELAKRFKEQHSHIPVILVTGWNVFPENERLKESGVDFVLHKPFNMKNLLNVIDEALAVRMARGLEG